MTERSKTRPGSRVRPGAAEAKDGANLKGLERRTRVSRRTAPRRKNDDRDDASIAAPDAPAADTNQMAASPFVGVPDNRDAAAAGANETARLRAALDRMPDCVAICDNDLVVTFANRALVNMLRGSQAELRKLFPGFDAGHLAGSCMDRFHSDPAWFRSQLDTCGSLPQSIQLHLGGLRLAITCSALLDADGGRVGTLLQWVEDPCNPTRSG